MSNILCIESSTKLCSVALVQGEKVRLKELKDLSKYIHQETLHVFADNVLSEAELKYSDLDAIAVGIGPGSYTGLRIGVSAAKGFAYALGIPVMAIPTLFHMAIGLQKKYGNFKYYIPMIDARRMEVYTATFDQQISKNTEVQALEVRGDSFEAVKHEAIFFGDGAEKTADILSLEVSDQPKTGAILTGFEASAMGLAETAKQWYKNQHFADLAYFEPYYYKDFIAGKPKTLF